MIVIIVATDSHSSGIPSEEHCFILRDILTSDRIDDIFVLCHDGFPPLFPPQMVLLIIHPDHQYMLNRNLLYTGVTRAVDVLVILGTFEALKGAVKNTKAQERKSMLKSRLEAI